MRQISVVQELRNDAISFGNEANLARAVPYIKDGLKPSQRAVIYAAYRHGYSSNKPHIKSLKLDGQIVGELWPHGSEYSTIVRLTQPFVMNLPLLDMHGANGSQLGTPDAAASRYTEVRLSKACEDGFLKTLDKNTCEWIPNYSEDLEWPKLFPAIIPNLYINGSDGMGYCYSQTWLPGNLIEFTNKVKDYIKGKQLIYNDIFPDFPTKGIIINKSDIHTIYETGQGTVLLRGKATINENTIIITELPYQVYVSNYMEQLKTVMLPDKKGEAKIPEILNIYNMSGDSGMHIEIEVDSDPQIVLAKLYKYTDLQISLAANQFGIIDGIPKMLNLQDYIKVYVEHNITCLQREYTYDLNKAIARLEIVDGLVKAISIIDKVITTIKSAKSSETAKQDLITKFSFTENQAKAIIDMRLGKLANLESEELLNEQTELNKVIVSCETFLKDSKLQQKEFIKRLSDFTKSYGWERRTEVVDIDLSEESKTIKQEKIEERFNIILTTNNELKKVTVGKVKKSPDILDLIEIGEKDRFILISNKGTMYKLNAKDITLVSQGSKGQNIQAEFFNDKIVAIYSGLEEDKYLFMITKKGLAKKILSETVFNLSKCVGAPIMKVDQDDEIISCECLTSKVISINNGKKTKTINTDDFLDKGRSAGGVVAIKPATGFKEITIIK